MDLKKLKQFHGMHECCPKDWKKVHDITGSHELDAVIEASNNVDLPDRLKMFVTNDEAYGPITGYSGYRNYRGDS